MRTKIIIGFIIIIVLGWGIVIGMHIKQTEYIYIKPAIDKITIDDPRLIPAIIKAESRGNPKAVSNRGAYGLMQVRYEVHKQKLKKMGIHKATDLFHPEKNIKAGKSILNDCWIANKGDIEKTLRAYSGNAQWYPERVLYYIMRGE